MKHSTADTPVEVKVEGNINPSTLTIGANNNEFTITENPSEVDEILITSAIADKDIVFSTNNNGTADTEVMRIVGANASLQMNTDKKIAFRDENTYVHSGATNELDMLAGQSIDLRAAEINLKASTDTNTVVQVTGKIKADGSFILYDLSLIHI